MKAIRLLSVVIPVIVLVVCLSGCAEKGNDAFLDWVTADLDYHIGTLWQIDDAMDSKPLHDLQVMAEAALNHVEKVSKPKCASFTVSGTYASIQTEYMAYLSDMGLYYNYTTTAAELMALGTLSGSTALENASNSLDAATEHVKKCRELMESL